MFLERKYGSFQKLRCHPFFAEKQPKPERTALLGFFGRAPLSWEGVVMSPRGANNLTQNKNHNRA